MLIGSMLVLVALSTCDTTAAPSALPYEEEGKAFLNYLCVHPDENDKGHGSHGSYKNAYNLWIRDEVIDEEIQEKGEWISNMTRYTLIVTKRVENITYECQSLNSSMECIRNQTFADKGVLLAFSEGCYKNTQVLLTGGGKPGELSIHSIKCAVGFTGSLCQDRQGTIAKEPTKIRPSKPGGRTRSRRT